MATFIIGALVFGTFAIVGYNTYKDFKKGKCCTGSCSSCSGCSKSNH